MSTTEHNFWMTQTPELQSLLISQLILPGSHDSGSDKEAPNLQLPQEITQDVSPKKQLLHGIRALDLRVAFYSKYAPGQPERFQLFHRTSSGRNVANDILGMLLDYFEDPRAQQEIVVLDFHEFRDFNPQAHAELKALIIDTLQSKIIPYHFNNLKVGEIWSQHPGKNVVVAYNTSPRHALFWYGVNHHWSGENLLSTHELKIFMDSRIAKYKSNDELDSIQCAKYVLPFFVPDDFSDKIDSWFLSEKEHSYIQNFFIINTDWTTRSQLVKNCRHANQLKAQKRLKTSLRDGRFEEVLNN
ncbi:hypothetical protein [Pseudomonas helleri]|uniref:hypothetical protein n=1 Tax=Pseudomonas helleri TaxID=1608996 RepID=UPI00242FA4DB|nr:hypothetical protein [Pseudomonas helleri]